MRIVRALLLVGLIVFSIFGFIATFEPMDAATAITWRVFYGLIAAVSAAALAWNLRPRK